MRGNCTDCGKPLNSCTCHEDKVLDRLAAPLQGPAILSNRALEYNDFSFKVVDHIENYTVLQYGDAPDDNVENWSARVVEQQIEKYVKRFGSNARGFEESQRDLLKIAHYCAILHNKRLKEAQGE